MGMERKAWAEMAARGPSCGRGARRREAVMMVPLLSNLDNWMYGEAIYQERKYRYQSRFGRKDNESCFRVSAQNIYERLPSRMSDTKRCGI